MELFGLPKHDYKNIKQLGEENIATQHLNSSYVISL